MNQAIGPDPQANDQAHEAPNAPHADRTHRERKPSAPDKHEQAARSVMHPDNFDPEWRYYHGAWGG